MVVTLSDRSRVWARQYECEPNLFANALDPYGGERLPRQHAARRLAVQHL
jgi:hypothetical protein